MKLSASMRAKLVLIPSSTQRSHQSNCVNLPSCKKNPTFLLLNTLEKSFMRKKEFQQNKTKSIESQAVLLFSTKIQRKMFSWSSMWILLVNLVVRNCIRNTLKMNCHEMYARRQHSFVINIHEWGCCQCSMVNWNGCLEPKTSDARTAIKVLYCSGSV